LGTKSFLDLNSTGTIKTLNISGAIALDLDASTETAITTLDASGMTAGGLTLNIDSASNTTITGSAAADIITADDAVNFTVNLGAGDDYIDMAATITSGDEIDGGADTDTIGMLVAEAEASDGDADVTSQITNFEKLRITDSMNANSFDISGFGINHLQLELKAVTGDSTVSGFTSGATIELRDATNATADILVGMTGANTSTTDSMNVFLNADLSNGDDIAFGIELKNIETVNINAVDRDSTDGTSSDDGYTIDLAGGTASNSADITTLNIEGSSMVTYVVNASTTALATIDGSSSTGELKLNAAAAALATGVTITGGSAADTITGGANGDTIDGGAGADSITLGAGSNNIVVINSITESKDDTITDGGGSTDTLKIANAVVDSSGTASNLIDLNSQDNSKLSAIDVFDNYADGGAGFENVDLSSVTKSVKVVGDANANTITSGAGADLFKLNGGNDVVIISAAASVSGKSDKITDFVTGADKLILTGDQSSNGINLEALTVTDNADSDNNTFLYNDMGITDIILHFNDASLQDSIQLGTATDYFVSNGATITAGVFDDFIEGGAAAQTIKLGAGNDIFVLDAGDSSSSAKDIFTDFTSTGTDKIILTGNNAANAIDLTSLTVTDNGDADGSTWLYNDMGISDVILNIADSGSDGTEDLKAVIQLGSTSKTFTSTAAITAGDHADVVQSGTGGQAINLGAGDDTLYYNSATTDATGSTATTIEAIDLGAGTTDTIVVAGGTTLVDFSNGDTITSAATNIVLELTKSYDLTTADINAQSIKMSDAQTSTFTKINALSGDTITLSDSAVSSAVLDGTTIIDGYLKLKLANGNNSLTVNDGAFLNNDTTVADTLYIDGSAMTGANALVFDGQAEGDATFVIVGGDGADIITGGQNADTITTDDGLDIIKYVAAAEFGDTITDFKSGTDIIKITDALTANGTDSTTMNSIVSSGVIGANDTFIEITTATAAGGADTAAEVATFLANVDSTTVAGTDAVVFIVNDGTDSYAWYYDANVTNDNAVIQSTELTLVAKLSGITDVQNGDFAEL